jgi:hypothetical protein
LSVITRFADRAELNPGVNVTAMVAVPPFAATLNDVAVVMAKSPGFVPVIDTPETCNGAVPEFVTVISVGALVAPVGWLPKFTLVGFREIDGALPLTPVPERATVCGLPPALSVIFSVADRPPVALGVNVTAMVAAPPLAATLIGEAVAAAKSPAFVPEIPSALMVSVAVPLFVTVINDALLVTPTLWLLKFRIEGLSAIEGAVPVVPVPLSVTICGLSTALSLMITVALRKPVPVGANRTVMVAVPPFGATVIGVGGVL